MAKTYLKMIPSDSPSSGHQPIYILNLLNFKLEFLIGVQSSDPLNTKTPPILLLIRHGLCVLKVPSFLTNQSPKNVRTERAEL
jgi:hypothetical protein